MKSMRLLAVPGLMLVGGLVLTGCGDKDTPASTPSPSESAMMEDTMSPSPMMSEDDDTMMTPSPSPTDAMMSDG